MEDVRFGKIFEDLARPIIFKKKQNNAANSPKTQDILPRSIKSIFHLLVWLIKMIVWLDRAMLTKIKKSQDKARLNLALFFHTLPIVILVKLESNWKKRDRQRNRYV